MPFKITCANGHAMMIRDEHAGRRVKCPTCGLGIVATAPSSVTSPSMATQSVPPQSFPAPPMARIVMDATLAEEEDHAPARIAPRPEKRRREKRRSKRIVSTAGLGLLSAGLAVEMCRIILMATSMVVVFSLAFFSARAAQYLNGGLSILVHLAGIAVVGLCFMGSRRTGGSFLLAISQVSNFCGFFIAIAALAPGPGTPVAAMILLGVSGIVCKLAGWILFVAYLKRLAVSLGDETGEDLAVREFRFTMVLVGETILIYVIALIAAILAPILGVFGFVLLGLVGLGAIWFIVHCVWYLVLYVRLLIQLRGTIARLSQRSREELQPMVDDPVLQESMRLEREDAKYDSGERRSESGSHLAWILGSVGAVAVLLVGGGGVLYFLVAPSFRSLPVVVKGEQQRMTREFGADRVVVVELRGAAVNSPELSRAMERIRELTGTLSSGRVSIRGFQDSGVQFLIVGGVKDIETLADNVDFGKVSVSTWQRQLVIDIDPQRIAQFGESKGPRAPLRVFEPEKPQDNRAGPAARNPAPPANSPPPSNPVAAPPRRETPIAQWNFDEEEGDIVKDLSGSGLHGKLVGCKRVAGIRGKGIEFAGQGSYFDYGSGPALNFEPDAPVSIAFWFRTSERGGTLLCQRKRGQEAQLIRLTFDPFGISAEVCGDQEDSAPLPARVNATLKVNDGQWHHVTLLRSGNDVELYVDGELRAKTTDAVAGGPITTDLRHLGADGDHLVHGAGVAHPHFKGVMDEFFIYVRELSPEEIRRLASK